MVTTHHPVPPRPTDSSMEGNPHSWCSTCFIGRDHTLPPPHNLCYAGLTKLLEALGLHSCPPPTPTPPTHTSNKHSHHETNIIFCNVILSTACLTGHFKVTHTQHIKIEWHTHTHIELSFTQRVGMCVCVCVCVCERERDEGR